MNLLIRLKNFLKYSSISEAKRKIFQAFCYYRFEPIRYAQRKSAQLGLPLTVNDRELLQYKNKHAHQRCFILGNGPSLTISDLELLKNEICFAFNKIFLCYDQTEWRPTYYLVEDHLVAQQNYNDIDHLEHSIKFFPNRLKLFVPEFKNSIYFHLNWTQFFPSKPGFGCDPFAALYWGETVTYTAIQLACFMGFSSIYLLGVDFNFLIPPQKDPNNPAVYIDSGEKNHFHADYRKPGEKWFAANIDHQEKTFLAAAEGAKKNGVKIFNATRGGKLEIFSRVKFDSVILEPQ
jgi:hypothetical protein